MIIYDVWTMSKTIHKLPSAYQVIAVHQEGNSLYIMDIDQKITIIDFSSVNKENFFMYNDISIANRKIKELSEVFEDQNMRTIFIPGRLFSKRMDEILTLDDYKMNIFLHMNFVQNYCVFGGKRDIIIVEKKSLLESADLLQFESHSNFQKSYQVVQLKLQFELSKIFETTTSEEKLLFLIDSRNQVYILTQKDIENIWTEHDSAGSASNRITTESQYEKLLIYKLHLTKLDIIQDCTLSITGIAIVEEYIYFYTNNQKSSFQMPLTDVKTQLSSSTSEGPEHFKLNIKLTQKHGERLKNSLFMALHSNFSNYFTKTVTIEQLEELLSPQFSADEKIVKDFICYSENESRSYYLILTTTGNVLFFPLFFSIVENENLLEFYLLRTGLSNIEQCFYICDNLILSDDSLLYIFDFEKNLWDVCRQIEIENICATEIVEKAKTLGFSDKLPKYSDKLLLRLVEADFNQRKSLLLKGQLSGIRYIQNFNSSAKPLPFLSQVLVLVYANKNIQILSIRELIYLLEDFSHENRFISAIFDSNNNYLYLCYEEGIVEVFRCEMASIVYILSKKETLQNFYPREEKFHHSIQNSLKELIEHLQTTRITQDSPGLLKKLLKSYHHSFADFNNIKWFSQSEIVKKTSYNDLLLFHLKSFFNYCNICFNEISKSCECSGAIYHPATKVFGIDASDEANYDQSLESQKELFKVDTKHLHLFLNNLNKDRFAFVREKLSILPIIYSLRKKNRESFFRILKQKYKFAYSNEEFFSEMYRSFFADPLQNVLLSHRDSENTYMSLQLSNRKISGVSYNTNRIVKANVDWKYEYLSYFFPFVLQYMDSGALSVLNFANSFGLKVPLVKVRIAYQGLGNTMTFHRVSLDSTKFLDVALEKNSYLHLNVLTNLTAFLISNNQISLNVTNAFANEIFKKLILSRKAPINIFILVLYFFNDSLPLSASAHYLINKFSKERELYTQKLEASSEIKQKMKNIFKQQINKLPNPDCLSKLELTFLMATLLLIPPVEWIGDSAITSTILSFVSLVTSIN